MKNSAYGLLSVFTLGLVFVLGMLLGQVGASKEYLCGKVEQSFVVDSSVVNTTTTTTTLRYGPPCQCTNNVCYCSGIITTTTTTIPKTINNLLHYDTVYTNPDYAAFKAWQMMCALQCLPPGHESFVPTCCPQCSKQKLKIEHYDLVLHLISGGKLGCNRVNGRGWSCTFTD